MAGERKQHGGRGILGRFRRDRRGVGAIEFAFIAPIMIVLYIGAVEVTVAMSVNKKLARASATVADLLTQAGTTDKAQLKGMVNVAQSIMAPYDPTPVQMTISGILVDASSDAKIVWSWKANGATGERAYEPGSVITIPGNLLETGAFYVRSELTYRHDMITSFPITGKTMTGIDMGKVYHWSPRVGTEVSCSDC